jgi:hypothetical protein
MVNQWKTLSTPSSEVEHHISTARSPIASKYPRLDSVKLAAAKKKFLRMEKDSIVRGLTVPGCHLFIW